VRLHWRAQHEHDGRDQNRFHDSPFRRFFGAFAVSQRFSSRSTSRQMKSVICSPGLNAALMRSRVRWGKRASADSCHRRLRERRRSFRRYPNAKGEVLQAPSHKHSGSRWPAFAIDDLSSDRLTNWIGVAGSGAERGKRHLKCDASAFGAD
jgi:hypothetical protein